MKLDFKRTFIIGLAFLTVSIVWSVYNAFVPVFLDRLIGSTTLVAFIMTIDNIFGVIFQPLFGRLSDKTNTRFGRRMPFIMIGVPVAALFFSLIPLHTGVITLMLIVIVMNFSMSVYRAPAVALMPDATPPKLRSKANGIINFMGGLGAVFAFLLGGKLFNQNEFYPFIVGAVVTIIALIVLLIFYKEPKKPFYAEEAEDDDEAGILVSILKGKETVFNRNPSLMFMLLAIFFWFCGYNGIETFFTLYCQDTLGIKPGDATQMLALLAGSFLLSAIPAGYIGSYLGRKRTMLIGIISIVLCFLVIIAFPSITLIKIIFIISGVACALININS